MTPRTAPLFALALAACSGAPPTTDLPKDTDPTETDTDTDTDADTDVDVDADTDADTDVTTPGWTTDTGTDTDTDDLVDNGGLVVPPGVDGWVVLAAGLQPNGSIWEERFDVSSYFFPTGSWWSGGVMYADIYDPLAGVDDCGTWFLSGTGLTYTFPSLVPLDPGTVTLSLPDPAEVELDEYVNGWQVASLTALGYAPLYGGLYALSASGDETPAFEDLPLPLPERVELVSPALAGPTGTVLPTGDLLLEWTGTHTAPLIIEAWADDPYGGFWELRCKLVDDGSFTIPAANLAPLPQGMELHWWLRREASAVVPLPDGRQIATVPYTSLRFSTITP